MKVKRKLALKWNGTLRTFYYWLEEFMGFQIKDYICKCAVHCILKDSKCKGMPIFFLQLQFYFPIQICHDHTKYILYCMLLLRLIEGEIQNYWMKTEINCILEQESSRLKVVGAAILYIEMLIFSIMSKTIFHFHQ